MNRIRTRAFGRDHHQGRVHAWNADRWCVKHTQVYWRVHGQIGQPFTGILSRPPLFEQFSLFFYQSIHTLAPFPMQALLRARLQQRRSLQIGGEDKLSYKFFLCGFVGIDSLRDQCIRSVSVWVRGSTSLVSWRSTPGSALGYTKTNRKNDNKGTFNQMLIFIMTYSINELNSLFKSTFPESVRHWVSRPPTR